MVIGIGEAYLRPVALVPFNNGVSQPRAQRLGAMAQVDPRPRVCASGGCHQGNERSAVLAQLDAGPCNAEACNQHRSRNQLRT